MTERDPHRPSGRQAVLDGWAVLPPTVHRGRFTSPSTREPSSLAWRTVVLKVVPPGYSRTDLEWDRAVVDTAGAERIRTAVVAAGPRLASASALLDRAIPLARTAGLADKRHLLANEAMEIVLGLDEHPLTDDHLDAIAADIAADAGTRMLPLIDGVLSAPDHVARLQEVLDQTWDRLAPARVRRSGGADRAFERHLYEYLSLATFAPRAGKWVPHFTDPDAATRAWDAAVELDGGLDFVARPVALGLDDGPEQQKPPLAGRTGARAPLDRSVQERARSAAKGAQSGGYTDELAAPEEVIGTAITAASSPLGLSTPHARTGLALGALLFMDADPGGQEPARGYASRKLQRFRQMIETSHRADNGRLARIFDAITQAFPELWVALHNLEHRGDRIRDHALIWRHVGGAPETVVRDLRREFMKEDAVHDGVVVTSIDGPGYHERAGDAGDDDAGDSETGGIEVGGRSEAEADAAVLFTVELLTEHEPARLRSLLALTREADSLGASARARTEWDAAAAALVAARIPLGRSEESGAPRIVTAADLATHGEFVAFLGRHGRS